MKILKKRRPLDQLIEQFIDERLELGRIDLKQAVVLYMALCGLPQDRDLSAYLKYLFARGIDMPTTEHLSSHFVGPYVEFLMEHFGNLRQREALISLRDFWQWCQARGYINRRATMPPDLLSVPESLAATQVIHHLIHSVESL